jgi:hypothetical protein
MQQGCDTFRHVPRALSATEPAEPGKKATNGPAALGTVPGNRLNFPGQPPLKAQQTVY